LRLLSTAQNHRNRKSKRQQPLAHNNQLQSQPHPQLRNTGWNGGGWAGDWGYGGGYNGGWGGGGIWWGGISIASVNIFPLVSINLFSSGPSAYMSNGNWWGSCRWCGDGGWGGGYADDWQDHRWERDHHHHRNDDYRGGGGDWRGGSDGPWRVSGCVVGVGGLGGDAV